MNDKKNNTGTDNTVLLDPEWECLRPICISGGYAVKRWNGKRTTVHRIVAGAKPGEIVDHINRNKLDNRRCNLRICNSEINNRNKRVRGYTKTPSGRFQATISIKEKTYYLGTYDTPWEAALVHSMASQMQIAHQAKLLESAKELEKSL